MEQFLLLSKNRSFPVNWKTCVRKHFYILPKSNSEEDIWRKSIYIWHRNIRSHMTNFIKYPFFFCEATFQCALCCWLEKMCATSLTITKFNKFSHFVYQTEYVQAKQAEAPMLSGLFLAVCLMVCPEEPWTDFVFFSCYHSKWLWIQILD